MLLLAVCWLVHLGASRLSGVWTDVFFHSNVSLWKLSSWDSALPLWDLTGRIGQECKSWGSLKDHIMGLFTCLHKRPKLCVSMLRILYCSHSYFPAGTQILSPFVSSCSITLWLISHAFHWSSLLTSLISLALLKIVEWIKYEWMTWRPTMCKHHCSTDRCTLTVEVVALATPQHSGFQIYDE